MEKVNTNTPNTYGFRNLGSGMPLGAFSSTSYIMSSKLDGFSDGSTWEITPNKLIRNLRHNSYMDGKKLSNTGSPVEIIDVKPTK